MRRALAAVALVALLTAGCGSDEDADDVAAGPTSADAATSADTPTSAEAPSTTEAPTTTFSTTEPPGASVTVPADSSAVAATTLTITVWELGRDGGPPAAHTLTCAPTGGDLPQPEAACAALAAGSVDFAPVPPDVACTEIYGGPAVATVTGTALGEPVDAEFSRSNGCEIARWESAMALLPADLNAWQDVPAGSGDATTP